MNPTERMQNQLTKATEMSDDQKMYKYKGVLYSTIMSPEENLKAAEGFQAREDDIMLVAYPKCGFNWMVGVVRKIMGEATGTTVESKKPPLIEFHSPEAMKELDSAPSPRLLGTHLHPDNIPASFYQKKTKMLVVFRNPKDTLVSFYHFCNNNPVLPKAKSWDAFYSDFMKGEVGWGSYFDHAMAWDKKMDDPNVKVITYEDMKQDLAAGVRDISNFFGYSLTEEQVQRIAEGSTFSAMKQKATDTHSSIGPVIFRKGVVGDWKKNFTPEQSKEMDETFKARLAGTRLGAMLKYEQHC